jgi:hypothetical protein
MIDWTHLSKSDSNTKHNAFVFITNKIRLYSGLPSHLVLDFHRDNSNPRNVFLPIVLDDPNIIAAASFTVKSARSTGGFAYFMPISVQSPTFFLTKHFHSPLLNTAARCTGRESSTAASGLLTLSDWTAAWSPLNFTPTAASADHRADESSFCNVNWDGGPPISKPNIFR